MHPGHDGPYHSPIRVDEVEAIGGRQFRLRFWNVAYAAGVQSFEKIYRTLKRGPGYLAAEEAEGDTARLVLFEPLTSKWFEAQFPELRDRLPFRRDGAFAPELLISLLNPRPNPSPSSRTAIP